MPAAGYPAPANHWFPPSSKWYGREVPLAAERRAAGPPGGAGLASTPSLGPDGAESHPHRGHRGLRRRGRLWRAAGVAGADPRHGRAAAGRFHRQTAAIWSAAALAPPLLRADGGQAAGGTPLSGVRLHPEGRHGPSLVAALQWPVQGPRLRPEGLPATGRRAGGDCFHRPPQAALGVRPVQPAQPPLRGRPRAG